MTTRRDILALAAGAAALPVVGAAPAAAAEQASCTLGGARALSRICYTNAEGVMIEFDAKLTVMAGDVVYPWRGVVAVYRARA